MSSKTELIMTILFIRKSPTVTFRIRLKIVEEPKKPIILDADGSAVMGTIGPFR